MASPSITVSQERTKAYEDASAKALSRIKELLESEQQQLQEYDSIIHCLEELPKKSMHQFMAPVGSVGFLPATIVRTNEVLVGLGDGYFVDTTAQGATEILKRRKSVIEKNISDIRQHHNIIIQQNAFAKQLFSNQSISDEVEIREDYDEAKESELRKKRRSRLKAPQVHSKPVSDVNAEAELLKRLEELELQEMRNGELDDLTDEKEACRPSSPVDVVQKLDNEDTKCLISILASNEEGEPSCTSQGCTVQTPIDSTQPSTADEPHEGPSSQTPVEQIASSSSEYLEKSEANKGTLEVNFEPAVFRGEDLARMLGLQSDVCEDDFESYQPPRGIGTEDFQKFLRMVEDCQESDSESCESSDELHHIEECADEGSELDSDDVPLADVQRNKSASCFSSERVQLGEYGEYVVQKVGQCGPLTSHGAFDKKHIQRKRTLNEDNVIETESDSENYLERTANDVPKSRKKSKMKKKKSVKFAEQLENATVIDSHAPPSDVRGSTICTSKAPVKQILSNVGEKSPIDEQAIEEMNAEGTRHNINFRNESTAFTGVFQERNLDVLTTDSVPVVNAEAPKPLSLFKKRRLHNDS